MGDLEQKAKEFCRANGIMTVNDHPAIGMAKFAQSLIDKGVLVDGVIHEKTKGHLTIAINSSKRRGQKIKELESTVSSAGKGVKVYKWFRDYIAERDYKSTFSQAKMFLKLYQLIDLQDEAAEMYANQFKFI